MDLKSKILTIGIALLLVFFVFYAVETFYPSPKWDAYCKPVEKQIYDQTACEAEGYKWIANVYPTRPVPAKDEFYPEGYCDTNFYCQKDYDAVLQVYEKNVFLIGIATGILLFVAGFLLQIETIGAGFTAGAVIIMIVSVMRYWGRLTDYARLAILGFALAVLIYIGYKKATQAFAPKKRKK